jgi:hypothetical protein
MSILLLGGCISLKYEHRMFTSDYRGGLNVQKALSSRHLGPGGALEPWPVSRRYAFRSRCMEGLYGLISGPRDATVGVVSSAQSDSCRYHAWPASRPETCWNVDPLIRHRRSSAGGCAARRGFSAVRRPEPLGPPAVFQGEDSRRRLADDPRRRFPNQEAATAAHPRAAPTHLRRWPHLPSLKRRTPAERRRPWTRRPSSLQIVKELKGDPAAFLLQGERSRTASRSWGPASGFVVRLPSLQGESTEGLTASSRGFRLFPWTKKKRICTFCPLLRTEGRIRGDFNGLAS